MITSAQHNCSHSSNHNRGQNSSLGRRLPSTVVTGATSGIGRELALQLAAAGVSVVALGRNTEALNSLSALNPLIEGISADFSDTVKLSGIVESIIQRRPDIGCLINNAAVQYAGRFDEPGYGAATIRSEVDVNLVAPMLISHALLAHFQTRPHALIVNITSGLAYAPKRSAAVYSATKAGMHLFTQALRVQTQQSGMNIVEVILPLVDTPMTAGRGNLLMNYAYFFLLRASARLAAIFQTLL
jgi:uncharacterized oxidoreductase